LNIYGCSGHSGAVPICGRQDPMVIASMVLATVRKSLQQKKIWHWQSKYFLTQLLSWEMTVYKGILLEAGERKITVAPGIYIRISPVSSKESIDVGVQRLAAMLGKLAIIKQFVLHKRACA